MKYVLVLLPLITLAMAQRPSYAGSRPIGKPELANRFRDPNEDQSVTVANRLGEGSTGSTGTIPIDARGDQELVNRLNQWPREHRPFWLINYEQIENQRNQQPRPNTNLQSRFSGTETSRDSIPIRPELPTPSFLSNRNSQ